MSATTFGELDRVRPLVAVVCAVPLLAEAMISALDFAEVRPFNGRGGDISGLLQWLRPDAVVVDSDEGARDALAYATDEVVPVLHVDARRRTLRLYRAGGWLDVASDEGPTPEAIRNAIAGALYGRAEARQS
jgi:hypothetical protein